ncbi:MAG: hypothetical protein KIS73_30615, partial [Enhydrobacter sp.]|nr:hypothetical protein [Enhydrobacter sp.]
FFFFFFFSISSARTLARRSCCRHTVGDSSCVVHETIANSRLEVVAAVAQLAPRSPSATPLIRASLPLAPIRCPTEALDHGAGAKRWRPPLTLSTSSRFVNA